MVTAFQHPPLTLSGRWPTSVREGAPVVAQSVGLDLTWFGMQIPRYLATDYAGRYSVNKAARLERAMALTDETKSMTLRMGEDLADQARAVAEVEGTTVSDVIREALAEHVDRRRRDPEFQKMLKRNLERHQKLLDMLADG